MNCRNLKWFSGNRDWPRYVNTIYLNHICIGSAKNRLLGGGQFLSTVLEFLSDRRQRVRLGGKVSASVS